MREFPSQGQRAARNGELLGVRQSFRSRRRYREIVAAVVKDYGGADRLSEIRMQLIHRLAACVLLTEQMEEQIVRGNNVDIRGYASLCDVLVRITHRLGTDQPARRARSRLLDYLQSQ